MASTKLIVSNRKPLAAKYGGGITAIDQALLRMQAADQARGISTEIIYLDDPAQMGALGVPPVTSATNRRENKEAVDGVWNARTPEYLMILGAPDVVPHQSLINPMSGDDDPRVPSDLPYASAAGFSDSISDFLGPTRVVGRLPDIMRGASSEYLVSLLDQATAFTPRPASAYVPPFAVSADAWKLSTATSVATVFGTGPVVRLSPPKGPAWNTADYQHRAHFVNCHGASGDPHWYGEGAGPLPVAFNAPQVAGKLREGTVAAVECCYGAELYDPALAAGAQGLCSTYLESGTCGFWGSTNIAYGPGSGQDAADIICQRFLHHVLQGRSVGAAALLARQDFISGSGPALDPADLKTAGQFILLGDPSVHPVQLVPAGVDPGSPWFLDSIELLRKTQRLRFLLRGDALAQRTAYPVLVAGLEESDELSARLRALAEDVGLPNAVLSTYEVRGPEPFFDARAVTGGVDRFHVLLSRRETETPVILLRVLVVAEENGSLRPVTLVESR